MQCAVIEFARNVLGWKDAHSTEFHPQTSHPVVIDMPEHNPGQMGATMRLGKRDTHFQTTDSVICKSPYVFRLCLVLLILNAKKFFFVIFSVSWKMFWHT